MKPTCKEILLNLVRAYEREVNPTSDWQDTALTQEEFDEATKEYRSAIDWLAKDVVEKSDLEHDRDLEKKLRKDAEEKLCEAAELLSELAMSDAGIMAEKATDWLKKNDPWRIAK